MPKDSSSDTADPKEKVEAALPEGPKAPTDSTAPAAPQKKRKKDSDVPLETQTHPKKKPAQQQLQNIWKNAC